METSKELPEFIALSNQLHRDMEQKDKETAARKKRKYQRDMKDYVGDLVFKWQNKSEESALESNSSSPELVVRTKDDTNRAKIQPNKGADGNHNNNNFNTPNQKQRWNGNNNGKKTFWKNNWYNNNPYNPPRPFQQPSYGRRPPTPHHGQTV